MLFEQSFAYRNALRLAKFFGVDELPPHVKETLHKEWEESMRLASFIGNDLSSALTVTQAVEVLSDYQQRGLGDLRLVLPEGEPVERLSPASWLGQQCVGLNLYSSEELDLITQCAANPLAQYSLRDSQQQGLPQLLPEFYHGA